MNKNQIAIASTAATTAATTSSSPRVIRVERLGLGGTLSSMLRRQGSGERRGCCGIASRVRHEDAHCAHERIITISSHTPGRNGNDSGDGRATVLRTAGVGINSAVQTGWDAVPTAAALLLLGALAIAGACALVAVIRCARSSRSRLAAGLPAVAVVATPLEAGSSRGFAVSLTRLKAYEYGYYVCLGGAATIVLAGLWAALSEPAPVAARTSQQRR